MYRMPEELTESDEKLSAKIMVTKSKVVCTKKGLTKAKNRKAAQRREYMMDYMQPPEDLVTFLHSDEVWVKVLEAAETNINDILVRRYVTDCGSCTKLEKWV